MNIHHRYYYYYYSVWICLCTHLWHMCTVHMCTHVCTCVILAFIWRLKTTSGSWFCSSIFYLTHSLFNSSSTAYSRPTGLCSSRWFLCHHLAFSVRMLAMEIPTMTSGFFFVSVLFYMDSRNWTQVVSLVWQSLLLTEPYTGLINRHLKISVSNT